MKYPARVTGCLAPWGAKGEEPGGGEVRGWFPAAAGCEVGGGRGAGEDRVAAGTQLLEVQVLAPHPDPTAWLV